MKKLLTILACFMLAFTSLAFAACGKKSDPISYRIQYVNLSQFWIEAEGKVYAKDGQYEFAQGCHHGSDIFAKQNLRNEVFPQPGYGGQGYITAAWNGTNWIIADDYQENNFNSESMYEFVNHRYGPGAYRWTSRGISDVNNITDNPAVTVTQLDNETITVGEDNVECIVWDYVYEHGTTYNHQLFYFAKDSHICLLEYYTSDKTEEVKDDSNIDFQVTLYKVGVSMNEVLTAKGRTPAPNMNAWN
ncbi:MAG: hypothetical protein IJ542_01700 [Clostridia bacterium]|nr:hypothetical protein [Clostridia bacterium]